MRKKHLKCQNMSTKVWLKWRWKKGLWESEDSSTIPFQSQGDLLWKFKIPDYMNSQTLTNHEVTLLFALRSRSVRSVATNFGQQKECSLGCKSQETQEHWVVCSITREPGNTSHIQWYIWGPAKTSPHCETLCTVGAGERGADRQGGFQLTSCCHHWS